MTTIHGRKQKYRKITFRSRQKRHCGIKRAQSAGVNDCISGPLRLCWTHYGALPIRAAVSHHSTPVYAPTAHAQACRSSVKRRSGSPERLFVCPECAKMRSKVCEKSRKMIRVFNVMKKVDNRFGKVNKK